MESQPQNPEFWINPENFHPCVKPNGLAHSYQLLRSSPFLILGMLGGIFSLFFKF